MLTRKMWRDIRNNFSQFIAIFLMIMIGVMAYSGIKAYMDGMQNTADVFYSENNLQDFNVMGTLTREDLQTIQSIRNVENAEGKLYVTATTDHDKTLLLSFIESNDISRFYVLDGVGFDSEQSGVWLDNYYAIENHIQVGDIISIKYDGLKLKEEVLGLINVPDHLYDTRDESELYPDRKEFGFAFLSMNEISEEYIRNKVMREANIEDETIFNMVFPNFQYKDYIPYNIIMVDVSKNKNKDSVKNDIEDQVSNAKAIIPIEDSASFVTYQGEIDEGKTYVGVFSGIFLFIALLSVITTMTRIVKKERVQIGTLKALGFSNRKVLFHYIGYGFWISVFASIVGLILGYFFIGNVFISLEMSFFEIPNGHPVMNFWSYIVALLVVLAVVFITYVTGRSILKENPADTLRTEVPKVKHSDLKMIKLGILQKLSFSSKWNFRDILRNKMRTLMGLAGVVGCCMLIVCALGMFDSMNYFIKLQFETLYHFDYKLNLKENITNSEMDYLKQYGNHTSQTLGIEIKDDKGRRESNNIFVTDASNYVRFVNRKNQIIDKPKDNGVFVTYKLAETKGYALGDTITWHIYGDNHYYTSEIIGFNKDPQNQNVTMTRAYLESLGLQYSPDSLYTNVDLSGVKEIDGVETIQDIESLKDGMEGMLSMMKTMLILIIGIAVLLGSIIIYNLGVLSFTEKQYQFATLKVLGFKDSQIQNIFVKQNNWIAICSILLGLPLGFYLTDWLFKTAIEEHYDFGASITTKTYIIGAVGTFLVSYFVSRILSRKIKNIDMVSSLKGNE